MFLFDDVIMLAIQVDRDRGSKGINTITPQRTAKGLRVVTKQR